MHLEGTDWGGLVPLAIVAEPREREHSKTARGAHHAARLTGRTLLEIGRTGKPKLVRMRGQSGPAVR
jgi:hypothetical protein